MRRSKSVWLIACLLSALAVAPAQQRPLPPLEKPESNIVPTLPSQFFNSPRIASADFGAALAQTPPLTFRLRTRGLEACYQVRFRGERPEAARLAFPGEGGPTISALHLAWDPLSRVHYLFFDGGSESTRRSATLREAGNTAKASVSLDLGDIDVSAAPDAACEPVSASSPIGQSKWHEGDGPNAGSVLARVEVSEARNRIWGWCVAEGYGGASTHGAIRNPDGGARHEWNLYSYVPADGNTVALALVMSKDWIDPRDGSVYRFVQSASGGFVPVEGEHPAFRIEAGPAVPRVIDVAVFGEKEWPGCASRAARRGSGE